jgi:hypothetical protein
MYIIAQWMVGKKSEPGILFIHEITTESCIIWPHMRIRSERCEPVYGYIALEIRSSREDTCAPPDSIVWLELIRVCVLDVVSEGCCSTWNATTRPPPSVIMACHRDRSLRSA